MLAKTPNTALSSGELGAVRSAAILEAGRISSGNYLRVFPATIGWRGLQTIIVRCLNRAAISPSRLVH
jgi:hypothetical protein